MKHYIIAFIIFFQAFLGLAENTNSASPEPGETQLMRTCAKGSLSEIEELLKNGSSPNKKTSNGYVAMDYAVQNRNPAEVIQILIKYGANPRYSRAMSSILAEKEPSETRSKELEKAFLILLEQGLPCDATELLSEAAGIFDNKEILKKLVNMGANIKSKNTEPNLRNRYENCKIPEKYPLLSAIENNKLNAIQFLLESGANPDFNSFDTPILYSVRTNEALSLMIKYNVTLTPPPVICLKNTSGEEANKGIQWATMFMIINKENLQIFLNKGIYPTEEDIKDSLFNPNFPEIYPIILKNYKESIPFTEMVKNAKEAAIPENIEFLKKQGVNIELTADDILSVTADKMLSEKVKMKMIDYLLRKGFSPNVQENDSLSTPLITAVDYHNFELADMLLQQGANPNISNKDNLNAVFYIFQKKLPDDHEKVLLIEKILDTIIKKGGLSQEKKVSDSILLTALSVKQNPIFIKHLINAGANVNFKNPNGVTPLMLAALSYDSSMVKQLLEKGAEINATDNNGQTALFYAAQVESDNPREKDIIMRVLINSGADTTIINKNGNSALNEAVKYAAPETVAMFLKKNPNIIINAAEKDIDSPLANAIKNNNIPLVQLLLKYGAAYHDNTQDSYPMNIAFSVSDEMKNLLISHGFKYGDTPQDIIMRKFFMTNALEEACIKNNIQEIKRLKQNFSILENKSILALMRYITEFAAKNSSMQTIECLEKEGMLSPDDKNILAAAENYENPDVLKFFIKLRPNAVDIYKDQVMFHAFSPKAVQILSQKGASLKTRNKQGLTPLLAIFSKENRKKLSPFERILIAEAMLKNGADIKEKVTLADNTYVVILELARDPFEFKYLSNKGAIQSERWGGKFALPELLKD